MIGALGGRKAARALTANQVGEHGIPAQQQPARSSVV
jgi:hypothetical protein